MEVPLHQTNRLYKRFQTLKEYDKRNCILKPTTQAGKNFSKTRLNAHKG